MHGCSSQGGGSQIVRGSNRIKNGRSRFTYRLAGAVEDQATEYTGKISGSKVTGTFKSGDLCVNEGKFTAKR